MTHPLATSGSARLDVIIIGSEPRGGTTAARLAQTGMRILLLERGAHLPRAVEA